MPGPEVPPQNIKASSLPQVQRSCFALAPAVQVKPVPALVSGDSLQPPLASLRRRQLFHYLFNVLYRK